MTHSMERLWTSLGLSVEFYNKHRQALLKLYDHINPDVVVFTEEGSFSRLQRLFQCGKTYRTARGRTAQVRNDHGPALVRPYHIVVGGQTGWATDDGQFSIRTDSATAVEDDYMLSGAIEDEGERVSGEMKALRERVSGLEKRALDTVQRLAQVDDRVCAVEKWRKS